MSAPHPPPSNPALRLSGWFGGQPYALLSLAMLLWALNIVSGRAVADLLPPITLALMRWSIALMILLPFTYRRFIADWPLIRARWGVLVLIGLCGVGLYNTLVYIGLAETTAINATVLSSLFPLVIATLGFIIYRDRLTVGQFMGISISITGALAVLTQGDLGVLTTLSFNPGDLWVIGSQIAYALYAVLLREKPSALHPLSLLTVTIIVGVVALAPAAAIEQAVLHPPMIFNATSLTVIAYVATLPALVAYICFNRGVALIGSNRAGVFFHLIPIFGSIFAITLLGEALGLHHVAGWGLILTGIAITQWAKRDP